MGWCAGYGLAESCELLTDSILVHFRGRSATELQPVVANNNGIESIREDLFIELFSDYSANFGDGQWASVVKCVEDSGQELVDSFLRKDWGAPCTLDSISVFLVSPQVHTDHPFVDPKELPNQAQRNGG
jgi:hypothetical protein